MPGLDVGGFRYVAGRANLVRREPRFSNNNGLRGRFPNVVDAPGGVDRMWRRSRRACGMAGACGSRLSEPNDQDDRAIFGRRHHRPARAAGRRPIADRLECRDRRREQAGSGHRAWRRTGGALGSRRLHASNRDLEHACDQQGALPQAALRSGGGLRRLPLWRGCRSPWWSIRRCR